MVETVVSYKLPVSEHLVIQKNRFLPEDGKQNIGRISIVTGIHGDELEGQYICYEIVRRMKQHPEYLNGTVDIYPALNPLGIDSATRDIPKLNMDMNRMFPGSVKGTMMDKAAAKIVEDIAGADFCVDIHASDRFVRELPQVRIGEEYAQNVVDYAKLLNADIIWVNASASAHDATLTHSLNAISVPAVVVEMGIGNQIDRECGNQIIDGIFYLMNRLGFWSGPVTKARSAAVCRDDGIDFLRAQSAGIFLPEVKNGTRISQGELIGKIVKPLTGELKETVYAKHSGLIFTLREYPVVYEGALLARVLTEEQMR